jgi:hypothetical protein
MAAVGEGDTSALSVGRRRCGGDDPFRIDDDGLIVRLRCTNAMRDRTCRGNLRPAALAAMALRIWLTPTLFGPAMVNALTRLGCLQGLIR